MTATNSNGKPPRLPTSIPPNPVASRTIAQSYAALPPRTRLYFSLGVCAFAAAGLIVSDMLENKIPAEFSSPR